MPPGTFAKVRQIAPLGFFFNGEPWKYPLLRRQQEKVSAREEKVWLTASGDAGLEWDVHPKNKRPIGERLALLAAGHVYGEKILCDPPKMVSMEVSDGQILLAFANASGGLACTNAAVPELKILLDGKQLTDCTISLSDARMIISSPQIHPESRIELLYAQEPYYESSIFNQAGIPALPAALPAAEEL